MRTSGSVFRLVILVICVISANVRVEADLFLSSSSSIQTLSVGNGQAIVCSTIKGGGYPTNIMISLSVSNTIYRIPIYWNSGQLVFAGPFQMQFPNASVAMEYELLQTTNITTLWLGPTNPVAVTVPPGKRINFSSPFSWSPSTGYTAISQVEVLVSNSTAVVRDYIFDGNSFSGPVQLILSPGGSGTAYTNGVVSYYFSEGFVGVPALGATLVPAGQAQLSIERSQNLTNWYPVFMKSMSDSDFGYYRFHFSR